MIELAVNVSNLLFCHTIVCYKMPELSLSIYIELRNSGYKKTPRAYKTRGEN